ncbi:hypothetical protein FRUB_05062 [Fimbriiglobus ruber]|uniref:Uncharacterized protein n=1 Tax=Fimbriiglobus ruber TaxID=1908690 RepID=A0A225DGQ9_9BACT|nr:hypothetical protein FRUB_05062 [Fimbriiglobus ruber]
MRSDRSNETFPKSAAEVRSRRVFRIPGLSVENWSPAEDAKN